MVTVGGSAGSLEVILQILRGLKKNVSFAVVIVLHRKSDSDSSLTDLLSYHSSLPVKEVEDKDFVQGGKAYLAPANYHLLVEKNDTFSLDFSEKINFSRPGIDVTFQTAAEAFQDSLVAVLLSGANADGCEGLKTVKKFDGQTIVQDPLTAEVSFMPQNAIYQSVADYILSPEEIISFLNKL